MSDAQLPEWSFRSLTPRVLSGVVLLVFGLALTGGFISTGFNPVAVTMAVPAAVFVRSFFVRATYASGELVVATWIRTRRFRTTVDHFVMVEPYSGFWWTGADGWLGANQYMLTLANLKGRTVPLPSTIGLRRRVEVAAAELNRLIDPESYDDPSGTTNAAAPPH